MSSRTRLARIGVPAISGTRPHLISMIDIRASGERNRMSAPSVSWKPPPKATPCTAAITGTGSSRQPHTAYCGSLTIPRVRSARLPRRPDPLPAFMVSKRLVSRPAQKARPSPERTTARKPFSVFSRSQVDVMASNISKSSAFILSARTRRTSATPSVMDTETRSPMDYSPEFIGFGLYRRSSAGFSQSTN